MELPDPGLMTDFELLSHVHTVHGPIPNLVHDPAHMTEGVMRAVRDMHDREHERTNHHHWHDYIILEDSVAEQLDGVYFREGTDGFDKRTNIWIAHCGQPNCFFHVSSYEQAKAQARYDAHKCPQEGGTSHYSAGITITLIEQCWEKLDLLYDQLQTSESNEQRDQLRFKLYGGCEMLSTFVSPFFKTAKEVATEVTKRYNMRDEVPRYETPGTQTRIFEVPKPAPTAAERVGKVLDEKQQKAIAFAKASGMFTDEQLAKTYDVSIELVRAVGS